MTLRWPVKAAVVVLVLGLAAWVAVPRATRAWQDHQDRKRIAAERVEMAPVAQVLLQIRPPAGIEDCGHVEWTEQIGDLCWRGTQTPGQTALAMERELRRVGATDVVVRCVRPPEGRSECGVQARVGGRVWGALVFQARPNGTPVVQLAGQASFPFKLPSRGTPVPPEQA